MTTWRPGDRAGFRSAGAAGALRMLVKGLAIFAVTQAGLMLLLALRLVERPLFGARRPVTPWITVWVCRLSLGIIGIRREVSGAPMHHAGAIVANHSSWLDIFVLNACGPVYFVSKAEVARWPVVGWLARATGTVFIARDPKAAKAQQRLFEARLRAGHRLLFFPEGTSTDGLRVLPFKPALFAALYTHGLEHDVLIQPATLVYRAPGHTDPRVYGWWGDMDFATHLGEVLAARRHGRVEVVFHGALAPDAFRDRKALAAACEAAVREAHGVALGDMAES
ncbi:MAG: lysophospholipid acyltransferase family protein [Paracoccaceae bacterium]